MEPFEKEKQESRETTNIVVGIIVASGGILLAAALGNIIPAIVGLIAAGVLYQSNH